MPICGLLGYGRDLVSAISRPDSNANRRGGAVIDLTEFAHQLRGGFILELCCQASRFVLCDVDRIRATGRKEPAHGLTTQDPGLPVQLAVDAAFVKGARMLPGGEFDFEHLMTEFAGSAIYLDRLQGESLKAYRRDLTELKARLRGLIQGCRKPGLLSQIHHCLANVLADVDVAGTHLLPIHNP